MSEQAGTTTETTAKAESPYWIGRHKRAVLGSLAVFGISMAGLLSWVGSNKSKDLAAEGLKSLRQDQACERVIDEKAGPKADTAVVRIGSLTTRQQADCHLGGIVSTTNVGRGYGYQSLPVKITDATVELPSRQDLHAAQAQDLKDSQTGEWSDLPFDVGMGAGALPALAFLLTATFSGDLQQYNHRPTTPHREQTTISA